MLWPSADVLQSQVDMVSTMIVVGQLLDVNDWRDVYLVVPGAARRINFMALLSVPWKTHWCLA